MATQTATKPSLTLKRRYNAPPAKVYGAWTEPDKLTKWFGPAGAETLEAETDARVGGRFHVLMRTADGELHGVSGIYREVVPAERLVFTWAWHSTPERESLVTITLKPDSAGTLMIFHHAQFFDETARDNHQRGWSSFLDKLDAFVA